MKKLSRITIMMVVALSVILSSCTKENVDPVKDNSGQGQHGGL